MARLVDWSGPLSSRQFASFRLSTRRITPWRLQGGAGQQVFGPRKVVATDHSCPFAAFVDGLDRPYAAQ